MQVENLPLPSVVFRLTLGIVLRFDCNRWDFLHGQLDTALNLKGQIQTLQQIYAKEVSH